MSKEPTSESTDETQHFFEPLNEFERFLETNRQALSKMMWEVPSLSIAAQAFLFLVALNPGSSDWVRMFAGILGAVTALATIQLLLKHRYHAETYSEMIEVSRRATGRKPLKGMNQFKKWARQYGSDAYRKRFRPGTLKHYLESYSSVNVWIGTFCLFIAGDFLIVIFAILDRCPLLHVHAFG